MKRALLLLTLSLIACGVSEVGTPTITTEVEVPTNEPRSVPTPTPTSTPTATPTPTPVPTQPPPEPIEFGTGSISGFTTEDIPVGGSYVYTVRGLEGQAAAIYLRSPEPGLVMAVGGVATPADDHLHTWRGTFAEDGDIRVEVRGQDDFGGAYRIDVIIPPPDVAEPDLSLADDFTCTMTLTRGGVEILYTPSPTSEVFSTAVAVGDTLRVRAMTPDGAYYGFEPAVAQAGNTGANRLRWVAAADADLSFLCDWVHEISLADVEADMTLDRRPTCQVEFNVAQAYYARPGLTALGSFLAGQSTIAYAAVEGFMGVLSPDPRYGYHGVDRLVWINTDEGDLTAAPECDALQAP